MTTLMRLRMSIPDRPGALAKVASIIAKCGANIASVDVHQQVPAPTTASGSRLGRGGPEVIDDLYVELGAEQHMWDVRDALAAAGCGTVVGYHLERDPVDPVTALLRHATELLSAGLAQRDERLIAGLGSVCHQAQVIISASADDDPAGRSAVETGAPVATRTYDPPTPGQSDSEDGWSVLTLARGDGSVVRCFRSGTDPFTSTEVARAEAVIKLYDRAAAASIAR